MIKRLLEDLGFSPNLNLNMGTSVYYGKVNNRDEDENSITMLGFDIIWKKGPWGTSF